MRAHLLYLGGALLAALVSIASRADPGSRSASPIDRPPAATPNPPVSAQFTTTRPVRPAPVQARRVPAGTSHPDPLQDRVRALGDFREATALETAWTLESLESGKLQLRHRTGSCDELLDALSRATSVPFWMTPEGARVSATIRDLELPERSARRILAVLGEISEVRVQIMAEGVVLCSAPEFDRRVDAYAAGARFRQLDLLLLDEASAEPVLTLRGQVGGIEKWLPARGRAVLRGIGPTGATSPWGGTFSFELDAHGDLRGELPLDLSPSGSGQRLAQGEQFELRLVLLLPGTFDRRQLGPPQRVVLGF